MVGIYFSGTGNTRYCVETFLNALGDNNASYGLEDPEALEAVKENETIVFGYSTQFSNVPKMVRDYVTEHGAAFRGKKVYVIVTMGLFCGDGTGMLGRMLRKQGATIIGGLQLRMPDSICDEKALKHTEEENQKIIQESTKRCLAAAQRMKAGNPTKQGLRFFNHIAGLFGQRLYFGWKVKDYSSALKVDEKRCTGCGLCVASCPMNNMKIVNGVAQAGKKCTMCYRCLNQCPKQALTLLGKKVTMQRMFRNEE